MRVRCFARQNPGLALLWAACLGAGYLAPWSAVTSLAQTPSQTAGPASIDTRQLILEVEANQKRAEALQRDYTYHVHTEEQEFDGQGRVKKSMVLEAESLTLQGVRVNRVTARNGKPLSPEDQRKEDERIDKEVERRVAQRAKLDGKGVETDSSGNALLPASRILELGVFTHPRREVLDGRPCILLDYAGDPHVKTRTTLETIVRDLTGSVWIDEAEKVMVRAQGEFRDDFKLGGGLLVNIRKGTHFDLRTTRVAERVWLPAVIDAQGSARILLVQGINGHVHLVTSDYRRFRANTVISAPGNVLGPDDQLVAPAAPTATQPSSGMSTPRPQNNRDR